MAIHNTTKQLGWWRGLRLLGINALVLAALLLVLEGGLRLTGAPHGVFKLWFSGRLGLYPENVTQVNIGNTPWVVQTNRWGFRSDEDLALAKTLGRLRIAMIGDSITDGFGVENANNFPTALHRALTASGVNNEVINGAHGGSSIDRQLAILRDAITPFSPDIVVLTFVTNDIHVLAAIDDARLLHSRADTETPARQFLRLMMVHTAVGETVVSQLLRWLSIDFARSQDEVAQQSAMGDSRYAVPGGDAFAHNAQRFMEIAAKADARILRDDMDPEMQQQLDRYWQAWDAFMAHCRQHGFRPVFVYYPAYSQVYDPSVSLRIRDLLREHSARAGVPFLDLTPVLREKGAGTVLHLAPRDYVHLNPAGNRVLGDALAQFLRQAELVSHAAQ